MDNKKDRISLIHEKGELVAIKFRGKTYIVENPNSNEIIKTITKEHPDFIDIWKKSNEEKSFKIVKGKKTTIKATKTLKEKNKKGLKAKLYAALGTVIVASGIVAGATACKKTEKEQTKEDTIIEELEETTDEREILDILNQLEKGLQRDSWSKINEFQNYFNNVASENYAIEEDENARLYLTAEQCIALFTRFNADRISPEDMAYIFGPNSSYFTFANLDSKFTEACRILNYYYLTATEKSGLDMLFVDESDKETFKNFEDLLIKYNKNRTEENKNEIVEALNNIFLNPSLDDPKTTNMGPASAIGTTMVPILHASKVVNEELKDDLVEINETTTCDKLKKFVEQATSIKSEEKNKNEDLLENLPAILDELNIRYTSRNIDFETRYKDILVKLYGYDYVYNNGLLDSEIISEVNSNDRSSISKSEAINEYGEEAVKNAENNAQNEFNNTYKEEQEKQKAYGEGLTRISNSTLYDSVYDFVSKYGYKPSVSNYSNIINSIKNSYTGSYKSSFNNGVDTGAQNIINNGYNDAIKEYNHRNNGHEETTTEEDYVEETPAPTPIPEPTEAPASTPAPTEAPAPTPEPSYIYEETTTEEEYIPEEELEETLVRVRG